MVGIKFPHWIFASQIPDARPGNLIFWRKVKDYICVCIARSSRCILSYKNKGSSTDAPPISEATRGIHRFSILSLLPSFSTMNIITKTATTTPSHVKAASGFSIICQKNSVKLNPCSFSHAINCEKGRLPQLRLATHIFFS